MRTLFIVVLVAIAAWYLYTNGIFDKLQNALQNSNASTTSTVPGGM